MLSPAIARRRFILVGCVAVTAALFSLTVVLTLGMPSSVVAQENTALESHIVPATGLMTHTVYLPAVLTSPRAPRPLGTVEVVSGASSCDGQTCYEMSVSCSQNSQPESATLKIGDPTGSPHIGTIIFMPGWTGTYFWDETFSFALQNEHIPENARISTQAVQNNHRIIDNLRAAGYRTVQIKWHRTWWEAEKGAETGLANLACNPATLMQWVYDNVHTGQEQVPFCATGHSNGATEVSHSLVQYGLADILDGVVLESGPNWTDVEHACLQQDVAYQEIFARDDERANIDASLGYIQELRKQGPCFKRNPMYREELDHMNIVSTEWNYVFPHTMISFIMGGNDETTTAAQADLFHDTLSSGGTPYLSRQVVPGAPHFVTSTTAGAQAVENAIRNACQIH